MPPVQPAVSAERLAKVNAARQTWIRQLVDMSRRNNLLYHNELKSGTLDLSDAGAEAIQALLRSGRTNREGIRLTDLVDATRHTQAAAAMAEIANRARSNFEERGLDTLFLAMGLATWPAADGGRHTSSPILLVPIQAVQAGGRSGPWSLRRNGDVKLNDVLLHALQEQRGVTIDSEALLAEVLGDDEGETFELQLVCDALRERAAKVRGFDVTPRLVAGNFAFQKMAIVKDLTELLDALAAHDIVAAIAGDPGAVQNARGDRVPVNPGQFDLQPPSEEFLIRDADSTQQQAIAATLRGYNGVISGPPGTGKSQTISNLIAELVARGKTVLFVAEKRAALEVVLNRLKDADLAHLCLDCHGAELSGRHIAEQFQESLLRVRDATAVDAGALHKKFVERRERLSEHERTMHARRQPWGITVFGLYGQLLALPAAAACRARVPVRSLETLDNAMLDAAGEQLREMAGLSGVLLGDSTSPWSGATMTTPDEVRQSLERARRLANERWKRWEAALAALLAECQAKAPRTLDGVRLLLAALTSIEQTLGAARVGLFRQDLPALARALAPAQSLQGVALATVFDGAFRTALRTVRENSAVDNLSAPQALALVVRVQRQLKAWRELAADGASYPAGLQWLAEAREAWAAVLQELEPLAAVFPQRPLVEITLAEAGPWLSNLASDATTPAQILKLHGIVAALKEQGLEALVHEIKATRPDPALWPDLLRHAWLWSCLEEIQLQDPDVSGFSGRRHDQVAAEFCELDRKRLEVAVQRIQTAHAIRAMEIRSAHPEQNTLVTREVVKRTRHLPLRRLFSEAPDVLLALRPCWMASPLSVSQLIPGETPLFDVVIFDEASQVLTEDGIASLLRGRQAVIAGDRQQLPPTTFFAAGDPGEESDQDSATAGFQSILDVMSSFLEPAWSLDWHYRSRDESLIAYSNHRIYNGRLITFPNPGGTGAVRHELVPHIPGIGAQEASVSAEVQRVVDLVRQHARTRAHESLGVITMGLEHAGRIEMALDRARQEEPGLEQLFAPWQRERFFVKNLERVQGDERDAIILSIGYAKNDAGQLVYRFGPLLQEGGERRLNVAITRARQRMTVVSSFSHDDVQADYPKLGVRLLRGFLEYAASGGGRFELGTAAGVPLNDFEQSVFDELARHGLQLVSQVGSSRYRIDMVVMHPEQEGRFVLAIECDGASYHSAPTARDRDRLRQQQLEGVGWRFLRIWSTDWFLRRDEEVQRALQAYQEAVRSCDLAQAPPSEAEAPSVQPTAGALADRVQHAAGPAAAPVQPRPGPVAVPAQPAADPVAVAVQPASRPVAAPVQPAASPVAASRVRGTRPAVQPGKKIKDYSQSELRDLVRWVLSDGQPRPDDEIVGEVTRELGFKRRGPRIVEAIEAAIRSTRDPDPPAVTGP